MSNPPPELSNYVANAYNAKDGNFLSKAVFALTYAKGQTVQWGSDGSRDIPDQVSASAGTYYASMQNSLLMENKADYDREFSASVNAEYSGVTYSGSVQSSLLYHGSLFTSTSSSYTLNYYLQSVLSFERISPKTADLDADFVTAITALPTDISTSENKQLYYDFFDDYGTHYCAYGSMGGTIFMETDIDDSVFESSSKTEVTAAISAGYNGIVSSGSLDVSTAYSSSEFLNEHKYQMQVSLNVLGGLYAADESISAWQTSLYNSPVLLLNAPQLNNNFSTLTCISALVTLAGGDATIASNIQALLPSYLAQDSYDDGLLGSPQSLSLSQVYNGDMGDGFVLATITQSQDGNRGYVSAYDDESTNPTTLRACASQHWYMHSDDWVPSACLTMPVPAATYNLTDATDTSGEPTTTVNFIGLGDIGEEGLGEWETIALNTPLTAASDGFVVAWVSYNNDNGARGYVQGWQTLSGKDTRVAASSQHYYTGSDIQVPCNSFCMPVCKGTSYHVDFTTTSNKPTAAAYFMPLSEAMVFFASSQSRTANRVYEAQTDGFLVACLAMVNNGDRGQVSLYAYPDSDELTSQGLLASTSIHQYSGSDIYVPYNTATIPVSCNSYYTASFTATSGSPNISLLWFPLGSQSS